MKGVLLSLFACLWVMAAAFGAVRSPDAVSRTKNTTEIVRETPRVSVRSGTRVATTRGVVSARNANGTRVGGARGISGRGAITASVARAARSGTRTPVKRTVMRAATNGAEQTTVVSDADFLACQEAYFSCMDQFCALQDEKYRRCMCSAKMETVLMRERVLSQTSGQLQDFKDLNIESIVKTPEEVKSMLNATEGELKLANTRDNSASAKKLIAISDVLTSKRDNTTQTDNQFNMGGDISPAWLTNNLVSGDTISDLTGVALYNAVNAQCAELVSNRCPSSTILNVIKSAYGMYIENDCAVVLSSLDKQANAANNSVRETKREMTTARLENYDSHNSTSINDCVAAVRADLTNDVACGPDYVHCLDMTGLYLNKTTGEPIYSANFYKLAEQISISGDVLQNSENAKFVTELNHKKQFAVKSLETCRDISDAVWDEFLRTAIAEIYQGQQEKIRQVKDNCMSVVNQCYDNTVGQLRDYSNIEEQMLLGARLVLSEEMCEEKLNACSNLYGGGSYGLELLVTEMRQITDQKIAQHCRTSLQDYAKKLCRVPSTDLHAYPYGCRTYTPGGMADSGNGTLYYKLKEYAGQYCTRPSDDAAGDVEVPLDVLAEVNIVLDSLRSEMSNVLSAECVNLGGQWITVYTSEDLENQFQYFYNQTNASTDWGVCININTSTSNNEES